jgi:hypothetical protein
LKDRAVCEGEESGRQDGQHGNSGNGAPSLGTPQPDHGVTVGQGNWGPSPQ